MPNNDERRRARILKALYKFYKRTKNREFANQDLRTTNLYFLAFNLLLATQMFPLQLLALVPLVFALCHLYEYFLTYYIYKYRSHRHEAQ